MLVVGNTKISFTYFQLTDFIFNKLYLLPGLFILFIFFQRKRWRENQKEYLLSFLTLIINFQDSYPSLLHSNCSSRCTLHSVANLIRFYILFGEKSETFFEGSGGSIQVENKKE